MSDRARQPVEECMSENVTASAGTPEEQLAALQAEFTAFKARVRNEAIRVKNYNGWCDSGVNESLRNLDLPGLPQVRTYRFEFPTTGVVRYEVNAYGPDEALAEVTKQVSRDSTSDRLRYGCKVGALTFDQEKVVKSGGHSEEELAAQAAYATAVTTQDDEDDDEDDD